MDGLSRKRVFPKTKGDSITGQDRAQKHCDFRFSQIEKKSKVAVLQLFCNYQGVCYVVPDPFGMRDVVDRNMPHSGAMVMCQKNTRISCLLI